MMFGTHPATSSRNDKKDITAPDSIFAIEYLNQRKFEELTNLNRQLERLKTQLKNPSISSIERESDTRNHAVTLQLITNTKEHFEKLIEYIQNSTVQIRTRATACPTFNGTYVCQRGDEFDETRILSTQKENGVFTYTWTPQATGKPIKLIANGRPINYTQDIAQKITASCKENNTLTIHFSREVPKPAHTEESTSTETSTISIPQYTANWKAEDNGDLSEHDIFFDGAPDEPHRCVKQK